MKNERNSNLEVLRIISMIFIVISHWNLHSGLKDVINNNIINQFIINNTVLGNIGVIIFFMITGYFQYNKNSMSNIIKKIIKIFFQVLTYSFGIYLVLVLFGVEKFNILNLVKSIFPITSKQYWFVTVYVVLMILSPYLNKLVESISKIEIKRMFIILTVLFIIVPTLTTFDYYGNELIQAIYFYLIGVFFRNEIFEKYENNRYIYFMMSLGLLFLSTICLTIIGNYSTVVFKHITYFYSRNSILVLILCMSLFSIFIRKKQYSNKIINYIASNVFAVYLISDNNYLRTIIWKDIFNVVTFANSYYLILNLILSISLTFLICILIEIIRKNTLEKVTDNFIKKVLSI